jgi:hypothetical protein
VLGAPIGHTISLRVRENAPSKCPVHVCDQD